jgi:hypothetical protein
MKAGIDPCPTDICGVDFETGQVRFEVQGRARRCYRVGPLCETVEARGERGDAKVPHLLSRLSIKRLLMTDAKS